MKDSTHSSPVYESPGADTPTLAQDSGGHGEPRNSGLTPKDCREFFQNACDAVLACDPEGRIVDLNARCVQMFGYTREELIGSESGNSHPRSIPISA